MFCFLTRLTEYDSSRVDGQLHMQQYRQNRALETKQHSSMDDMTTRNTTTRWISLSQVSTRKQKSRSKSWHIPI